MIEATADDSVVSDAFNVGMPVPGPHRVLRSSIDAAEAVTGDVAGIVRIGGEEVPLPPFAPSPPSRDATGTSRRCRSTPAGRSAP